MSVCRVVRAAVKSARSPKGGGEGQETFQEGRSGEDESTGLRVDTWNLHSKELAEDA